MLELESLPPEVLVEIFSHLDWRDIIRLSQTCTTLCEVCQSPTLWLQLTNMDFTQCAIPDAEKILNMLDKSPNLESISLGDVIIEGEDEILDEEGMEVMEAEEAGEGEGSEAQTVVGEDLFMVKVLRKLSHLRHIHLYMCGVTDRTVDAISAKCVKLQSISIHDNKHVSSQASVDLVLNCPFLTRLHLNGCEAVSFRLSQQGQLLNLTHVSLTYMMVNQENVRSLVASCPKLCHLDLTGSVMLNQFMLKETGNQPSGLDSLETLVLRECPYLTSVSLYGCPQLKSVSLARCEQLNRLDSISCPLIHTLNLEDCRNMNQLNLSQSDITHMSCRQLDQLSGLHVGSDKLHTLDLSECCSLSSGQVISAIKNKSSLTTLNIYGCTSISPDDVNSAILTKLPRLETLVYGGNSWTTVTLTSNSLHHLTISACSSPTGVQLHIPTLQHLKVEKCHNVFEQDLVDSLLYGRQISRMRVVDKLLDTQCKEIPFHNNTGTPDLQTLICSDIHGLHGDILSSVLNTFSQLVKLQFFICKSLSHVTVDNHLTLQTLEIESCSRLNSLSVTRVPSLKHLSVKWCSMVQTMTVESETLATLDMRGTNVAHLRLHCDTLDTLQAWGVLTQPTHSAEIRSTHLERLEITKCDRLTDQVVADILCNCPSLSSVTFIGSADLRNLRLPRCIETCSLTGHRGLRTVTLDHPTRTRHLTLNNLPKFSPDDRRELLRECEASLRVLEVRAIPGETTLSLFLSELHSLTLDQGIHLAQLSIVCPQLKSLRIQGCPHLQSLSLELRSLAQLQVYHSMPLLALRQLTLTCSSIPELHTVLACYCPKLQELHLHKSELDTKLLVKLGNSLCHLQTVSLYNCVVKDSEPAVHVDWSTTGSTIILLGGRQLNIKIFQSLPDTV